MADVSFTTLIAVAIFTGLGSGVGTPIGNWLFKKYLEPKMEKAHDRVKSGQLPVDVKLPTISDEKIAQMLGKRP